MSIYDIIMHDPALTAAVHAAQAGTPQSARQRRRPLTDGERRARNRLYSRRHYWKTRQPKPSFFCEPLIP